MPETKVSNVPISPDLTVSIIIDSYNYEDYLGQAIDSALKQTHKPLEVIVIDDGSTDGSREIIKSFGSDVISIFKENGGQATAFNEGIRRAKGSIICILDSDDYFHPDKTSLVAEAFGKNPDWVQVSDSWTPVDKISQVVPHRRSGLVHGDVRSSLLKIGRYKKAATASALSYRRDFLMKVLPIPDHLIKGADSYLATSAPFYGKVGCINKPLTYYRIHGKNGFAGTLDYTYRIQSRVEKAGQINRLAQQLGLPERFKLENDVDYRVYSVLQGENATVAHKIMTLLLTMREVTHTAYLPHEAMSRLLWVMKSLFLNSSGRR